MTGMDNYYRPPGGGPQDHQPTEQFWSGQTGPAGQQGPAPGYGYPWQQQPGLQAHLAADRRKALHWTVGITLAALLAGGGALAGVSLAGNPLSATPAASTAGTGTSGTGTSTGTSPGGSTGSRGQAALLNAALTAADSPDAALTTAAGSAAAVAGTPGAPGAPGAPGGSAVAGPAVQRCLRAAQAARAARLAGHPRLARGARAITARCRYVRRRIVRFFLLRGVDGQFTFRTRTGALRTLAYERGVIETLNPGSSLVVKAADGTTWTWDLTSSTVVRDGTGKVGESVLATGEPVWVGGPVVNGAKDARLIFVRPPSGTS